jgi:predicted AlkP superfamily phosphohydrolase/phosphomutase
VAKPVIAIGLDAAEPTLIERWCGEGLLPNLSRMRAAGAYGRLSSHAFSRAETPWTVFLTAVSPERSGYWSPVRLRAGTYELEEIRAYDFAEYPPFYALGDERRVAIFDVPQATLSHKVNGLQVLGWGAHSPQTPSGSRPEGLLEELIGLHGEHPLLMRDNANIYDLAELRKLQEGLETGIARRSAICRDLLGREAWDLFLTIFGSFHSAGHVFWHLSDPNHPLYPQFAPEYGSNPLLEIFVAADRAIGEIVAAADRDATIVIFSAHGMAPNVLDTSSMVMLPEMLYRWSFPGRTAIAPGRAGAPAPRLLPGDRVIREGWPRVVWSLTRESSAARSLLKRRLPDRWFRRLERFLGKPRADDPQDPFDLHAQGRPQCFQPATWFQHLWPRMKAFALPSFSEGYVRVNLAGREPQGIVPPAEYDAVCEQLTGMLRRLTDARTGKPLADQVIRTRRSPDERDPHLPDADLVVIWDESCPTDVCDSPELGRVGPIPFFRSGGHNANGFLLAAGPGIAAGSALPESRAVDLAPTILALMGAPQPQHLEGRPILASDARGG